MQINDIQINGFGNLKDKKIKLENGINIIKGKNETGKSTLLKFIPAMFYGLAKTKNGKDIPDLEKYKPWNAEEFSGKIYYTLDNNEKIEVYRDFNKKVCKVYNENGEEITNNYDVDKSKQSLFFIEQTGITEDILLKTAITEQTETKLNKEGQNTLIQKISNVLSTGSDNVSYKKALTRLKDKQTEEVGTDRTIGRPINIIKNNLKKYRAEELNIKADIEKVKNYETEKIKINNQIKNEENYLKFLSELKSLNEKKYLENEKININNNSLYEYSEKIEELNKNEKNINKNNIIKKDNKYLIIFLIILILSAVVGIFLKNIFITITGGIISLIFLFLQINKNSKNNKIIKENNEKILKIKKEIENIEKIVKEKEKEILKQKENSEKIFIEEFNVLIIKYNLFKNNININEFNIEKIKSEISWQENKINNLKLKISTLDITYKNVLEKLEKMPVVEEKIKELEEQEEELISLNNSINLARQVLEEAYEKMKENITPEFVNNLSNMIRSISDSKYENVKFNDVEGLFVELKNGEYVKADKLSIGTIDQMYLSLRLASLNEIVKEKMPIILDEAFAYYDDERLINIFNYLNKKYNNIQIIIFTCTDRELKALERENIGYNLIELY